MGLLGLSVAPNMHISSSGFTAVLAMSLPKFLGGENVLCYLGGELSVRLQSASRSAESCVLWLTISVGLIRCYPL